MSTFPQSSISATRKSNFDEQKPLKIVFQLNSMQRSLQQNQKFMLGETEPQTSKLISQISTKKFKL